MTYPHHSGLMKKRVKKGDRLLFLLFCPRVETLPFLTEKAACPLLF